MSGLRIMLSNAYNARNSGDGLLVDLSVQHISTVAPDAKLKVVAVAPETFVDHDAIAAPSMGPLTRRFHEATRAAIGLQIARIRSEVLHADKVVAVGGGYLRFGSPSEALKTRVAHLSQLRQAQRSGIPYLLLPQSIGPLRHAAWDVRNILASASLVIVRDDRSAAELAGLDNLLRLPDLAVMETASKQPLGSGSLGTGKIGVVLRPLRRFSDFPALATDLARVLGPDGVGLLQSAAGSGNQDESFSASVGLPTTDTLSSALQDRSRGVAATISVRMHGALQSILGGVPSVHLSYERKGFSAFEDMGLSKWVHHARSFEPKLVAEQARSLVNDSAEYWERLNESRTRLTAQASRLDQQLAEFLHA